MAETQASARPAAKPSGPIQFTTLNRWRRERAMLEVFLVNGQRLVGRVRSFDRFSMLLEMPQGGCFVFHHTVSTLQPASKGTRRPGGPPGGGGGLGAKPRREPMGAPQARDNGESSGPAPAVKVVRRTRRTIRKDD